MRRRFQKKMRAAIKAYYESRKRRFEPLPKQDILDLICELARVRGNGIKEFTACAGTFWFKWFDGVTTIHNESDWWRMKKAKSVAGALGLIAQ